MLDDAHSELKARLASTEERLNHAESRLAELQGQHAELEEKLNALQTELGTATRKERHKLSSPCSLAIPLAVGPFPGHLLPSLFLPPDKHRDLLAEKAQELSTIVEEKEAMHVAQQDAKREHETALGEIASLKARCGASRRGCTWPSPLCCRGFWPQTHSLCCPAPRTLATQ